MMLNKRGYFFVLDAVLGLLILVMGVFLISSSYVHVRPPVQVGLLSDDLINFLSSRKIKDINNPYAGIGGTLWNQGEISDADNTLLQQIGEFYYYNKKNTAENFIQNASKEVMPIQFRYEVWIDNTIVYPQFPTQEHINSKNNTKLLLTSKRIAFGIANKTTNSVWGPYKAEVFVWEK